MAEEESQCMDDDDAVRRKRGGRRIVEIETDGAEKQGQDDGIRVVTTGSRQRRYWSESLLLAR